MTCIDRVTKCENFVHIIWTYIVLEVYNTIFSYIFILFSLQM